jgi:hypothetical protein
MAVSRFTVHFTSHRTVAMTSSQPKSLKGRVTVVALTSIDDALV